MDLRRDFPPGGLPAYLWFGGRPALLRCLRPGDAARLQAFFRSHTEQTVYHRYGYHLGEMSDRRALELVSVDQNCDAALGVFEQGPDGPELIAVGRACRGVRSPSAEVAFVVREDRRRLGIATALLAALATLMRARGVRRLLAQVQSDNRAMLELFRRAGGLTHDLPGANAEEVVLDLEERVSARACARKRPIP